MGKFALLMYMSEFRLRVSSFDYRTLEVESLRCTGHVKGVRVSVNPSPNLFIIEVRS